MQFVSFPLNTAISIIGLKATQSSTSNEASHAVDGDFDTFQHTGKEIHSYLTLDVLVSFTASLGGCAEDYDALQKQRRLLYSLSVQASPL